MKTRIRPLLPCLALALTLSGCDFVNGLFLPPVSLAEAKDAYAAVSLIGPAALTDCTVDNGSTSTVLKMKSPDGTLEIEWVNPLMFPSTLTVTCADFVETTSGYTFNGTLVGTLASSSESATEMKLFPTHASKPVMRITGTVETSGTDTTGTLRFNRDTYSYSQLTS